MLSNSESALSHVLVSVFRNEDEAAMGMGGGGARQAKQNFIHTRADDSDRGEFFFFF